ncbi:MAG: hypothetical protein ACTSXP_13315 [Promethearchaeota archaeon]
MKNVKEIIWADFKKLLKFGQISGNGMKIKATCFVVLLAIITSGFLLYFGPGVSFKLLAPSNSRTTISFWGSPKLKIHAETVKILPLDATTLNVTNESIAMFQDPPVNYSINTFYRAKNCTFLDLENRSKTAIIKSWNPCGLVYLETPIPDLSKPVNLTFQYTVDAWLLRILQDLNSTFIYSDFAEGTNFSDTENFDAWLPLNILDAWNISFFLYCHAVHGYPNIWNYQEYIDYANETLFPWGQNYSHFRGIAADYEANMNMALDVWPDPDGRQQATWGQFRESWIFYNVYNQDQVYKAAEAIDDFYRQVQDAGYETLAAYWDGELRGIWDGDVDGTWLPVGRLKHVSYFALMNYRGARGGDETDYRWLLTAKEQVDYWGSRGRKMLVGIINRDPNAYYTPDELGLMKFIDDMCMLQAMGIDEIFIFTLRRDDSSVLRAWGQEGLIKLNNALNTDKKQAYNVPFTPGNNRFGDLYLQMVQDLMYNHSHLDYFIYWWCMTGIASFFMLIIDNRTAGSESSKKQLKSDRYKP